MDEVNLAPDLIDRTAAAFTRFASIFGAEHLAFVALAAIPAAIWLYIFFRHQRENKLLTVVTFLGGMLGVVPIFILQHEITRIEGWIEAASLSAILMIFLKGMWVGIYEETAKHWILKSTGRRFFRNIDDAIQLSIVVGLGFAFTENALYFYSIWNNPAISNFWFYFIFRSIGSMFLHILASGIFGYFYGIAHFAKPILQEELKQGGDLTTTKWLHRILHLKSEVIFYEQKITQGLLVAAVLHGVFDFLMGMSQHYSDAGSAIGTKLWLVSAVPFLVGGYFWLTYLLDRKENHKLYAKVCEKEECDILEVERIDIEKTIGNLG
ncbi:MAG: PrsW family glutamic-type intramembrane protease [Candidatus Gracilibacteria bacterium]|nr:PrsW family glutamic-type intramembrane protease [Candidatus Gracilibacteria bacterium]MDD5179537.1 PrsW family glutamic-type intramembrane protease [Candidatus Gracilibacteria bacterium]